MGWGSLHSRQCLRVIWALAGLSEIFSALGCSSNYPCFVLFLLLFHRYYTWKNKLLSYKSLHQKLFPREADKQHNLFNVRYNLFTVRTTYLVQFCCFTKPWNFPSVVSVYEIIVDKMKFGDQFWVVLSEELSRFFPWFTFNYYYSKP